MRKLALVAAAALALAGCGSIGAAKTLTVFAAASLTESFTALAEEFEADNAGVEVVVNFAGSSALAQQIGEGAAVDVFASADEGNMGKVADQVLPAQVFATNRLVVVTPPGNPARVAGLADLARDGLAVVLCAPQVPCGSASVRVEEAAGVDILPVSEEQDVKAVLTKVRLGEADAGLVYVTDAQAAGDEVGVIDFPESEGAVNPYPIAMLENAPQPGLAAKFLALVTGADGQAELGRAGFGTP
ncbi:molybdate ABC transporter substrate-binding protein [Actinokineospora pegani]|uniref:molybdate ABC transporter substrate-binding protein n=1 Tax=Actinokineospora pegani TaxID=2654637 RepID=UPI0012EA6651|nr:molybdate ABC transporter substrate-binding protein [Actinokineospora pegani]